MARTKKQVDENLIFTIIQEVEKDGPLANMGKLYEAVAEEYNKRKNVALSNISPSTVTTKSKAMVKNGELDLKTKTGRRGRQAGDKQTARTPKADTVLMGLTDWETRTVERGRGKGNEITSRLVLIPDIRNWTIATEKKGADAVPLGHKYYGNFKFMLKSLELHFDINVKPLLPKLLAALEDRLGKPKFVVNTDLPLEELGNAIDDAFQVSYMRYENVRERVLPDAKVSDEEE